MSRCGECKLGCNEPGKLFCEENLGYEQCIDRLQDVIYELSSDKPENDDWEKYSEKLWKAAYERGKADRPQGEWIVHKINGIPHTAECSCCHNHYDYEDLRRIGGVKWIIDLSYCPICGAQMKRADDEV